MSLFSRPALLLLLRSTIVVRPRTRTVDPFATPVNGVAAAALALRSLFPTGSSKKRGTPALTSGTSVGKSSIELCFCFCFPPTVGDSAASSAVDDPGLAHFFVSAPLGADGWQSGAAVCRT